MVSDPYLFTFSLVDTGAVLFLLVYFVSFLICTENSYIKWNFSKWELDVYVLEFIIRSTEAVK